MANRNTRSHFSTCEELSFPLELPAGADPGRCTVAVFVQDWLKGNVHQADATMGVTTEDLLTAVTKAAAAAQGASTS